MAHVDDGEGCWKDLNTRYRSGSGLAVKFSKMKLMLICNDPDMAFHSLLCGVDRIFVDLEINGKLERQGHRDTVVSQHTLVDVRNVKERIGDAELLVRVNPLFAGSAKEVDDVIACGADILMLPMFETGEELKKFVCLVNGRAKIIPLVETPCAAANFDEIVNIKGIDEFYFGLNDLHLAMGLDFMFELLVNGTVERLAASCRQAGIPFGFGGIARMEEGLLPGYLVLAEHMRLGSGSVILSRTFHRQSRTIADLISTTNFEREVALVREHEKTLLSRNPTQTQSDRSRLIKYVNDIVETIRTR